MKKMVTMRKRAPSVMHTTNNTINLQPLSIEYVENFFDPNAKIEPKSKNVIIMKKTYVDQDGIIIGDDKTKIKK